VSGPAAITVLAVMLAMAPVAAANDEVLASLSPDSASVGLSAYGGHVVWSQQVGPSRHVLMRWRQGHVGRLRVAEAVVPFDVNVGPDARGRAVAVYSRCRGDGAIYRSFARCDVYRLPLTGGRERRIVRISDRGESVFSPAIWRGNIAYAVWRSARAPVTVRLLRRGAKRAVALARLSRQRLGQDPDPNNAAFHGIGGIDLTSNAVVFQWAAGGFSELRRVSLSGRGSRVLDRGFVQEGLAREMRSPNATPRETLWVTEFSNPCGETTIFSDRAGSFRSTPPTLPLVRWLAQDGRALYAITVTTAPCQLPTSVTLVRLAPLSFAGA
jgi:hypothetical protein